MDSHHHKPRQRRLNCYYSTREERGHPPSLGVWTCETCKDPRKHWSKRMSATCKVGFEDLVHRLGLAPGPHGLKGRCSAARARDAEAGLPHFRKCGKMNCGLTCHPFCERLCEKIPLSCCMGVQSEQAWIPSQTKF